MMTDPIADMLTQIRNALQARHESVTVSASKTKRAIAGILRDEGFVEDFAVHDDDKSGLLELKLRYEPVQHGKRDVVPVIKGLRRVSRPGLRVYRGKDELPTVLNGIGVAILSTSSGVLTDRQCRESGVGGEVLCEVW